MIHYFLIFSWFVKFVTSPLHSLRYLATWYKSKTDNINHKENNVIWLVAKYVYTRTLLPFVSLYYRWLLTVCVVIVHVEVLKPAMYGWKDKTMKIKTECQRQRKKKVFYLQHSDFSQCYLLDDWIILRFHKLLDSHYLACFLVSAFKHHSIGALANLSQLLVLLHSRASKLEVMNT